MDVIYFTVGATDPLPAFDSQGVHFLALVDGTRECHVSCAHLDPGTQIPKPSLTHAALLVVHGKVTVWTDCRIQLSGGMGGVFAKGEAYSLETDTGAIILVVVSDELAAHRRGISAPDRYPYVCSTSRVSTGMVSNGSKTFSSGGCPEGVFPSSIATSPRSSSSSICRVSQIRLLGMP